MGYGTKSAGAEDHIRSELAPARSTCPCVCVWRGGLGAVGVLEGSDILGVAKGAGLEGNVRGGVGGGEGAGKEKQEGAHGVRPRG
jgi:hypothetical protein